MGDNADLIFANSTWTANHMKNSWKAQKNNIITLYPPCNVDAFSSFKDEDK